MTKLLGSLNSAPEILIESRGNQTIGLADNVIDLYGKVWDSDADIVTVSATINGVTKTQEVGTPTMKPVNDNFHLKWDVGVDSIVDGAYSDIVVTANDGIDISSDIYTGIALVGTEPAIYITNKAYPKLEYGVTNPYGKTLNVIEIAINGSQKEVHSTDITTTREYTVLEEDLTELENFITVTLSYEGEKTVQRKFKIAKEESSTGVIASKEIRPLYPLVLEEEQPMEINAFINELPMVQDSIPVTENEGRSLFLSAEEGNLMYKPTLKFNVKKPISYGGEIKRMLGVIE